MASSDRECPICQDGQPTDIFTRTSYGHEFHEVCLKKWFDVKYPEPMDCPTCRRCPIETHRLDPSCPICQSPDPPDPKKGLSRLRCGHMFHWRCLVAKWLNSEFNRCPICASTSTGDMALPIPTHTQDGRTSEPAQTIYRESHQLGHGRPFERGQQIRRTLQPARGRRTQSAQQTGLGLPLGRMLQPAGGLQLRNTQQPGLQLQVRRGRQPGPTQGTALSFRSEWRDGSWQD